jgi:hypothetical protein
MARRRCNRGRESQRRLDTTMHDGVHAVLGIGISACTSPAGRGAWLVWRVYCKLYDDSGELVINVQQEGEEGRNEHADV